MKSHQGLVSKIFRKCSRGAAIRRAANNRPRDDNGCEASGSDEKSGEERGALRHGLQIGVLVGGVGAIANSAESVESGNAECGSEIAIGTAPRRCFT